MKEFQGKTAVVTGAASGIGLAMVRAFAGEGMKVVLADIDASSLEKTTQTLQAEGFDVVGVPTDVADPVSVEALAQATLDAYGQVNVLCNNAGVALSGNLIWERTLQDWEWSFRVNVWGVIHGIRTFVPIMLANKEEGHIVNTASTAGIMPNLLGAYAVTKRAVVSISEYLYRNLEEVDARIKTSVLCPGYVRTEIGTSARNRQQAYRNQRGNSAPIDTNFQTRMRLRIESGMYPDEIAAAVIDGIRSERFWIIPDDSDMDVIRSFHDSVTNGTNPRFSTQDI